MARRVFGRRKSRYHPFGRLFVSSDGARSKALSILHGGRTIPAFHMTFEKVKRDKYGPKSERVSRLLAG
jgi:hypothetical protein